MVDAGTATINLKVEFAVYSIQEVADILKVDHKVIREAVKDGSLKAFRVGRQWRITQEALVDYMVPDPD